MQQNRYRRIFWRACAALVMISFTAAAGETHRPKLAILPVEINDTSGEMAAPDSHDRMLAALTAFLTERIGQSNLYALVPQARVAEAVQAVNSGTYLRSCNGCELDIARKAGADQVMIAWIWKVSSLVLTLHIEIKDVGSGRSLYRRVFDFRGDNETAWKRAADYMAGTLAEPSTN